MSYPQPHSIPPVTPKKSKKWPWGVAGVFGLLVLGSVVDSGDEPASTTVADTAAPRASTVQSSPSATIPVPAPEASPSPVAPAVPVVKTCTVPDVVGQVHQSAQNTMQAAGLYFLREQDATGQGRMLVYDRNWKTTAQSVAAGTVVDCTTEIMLSAKKIGE